MKTVATYFERVEGQQQHQQESQSFGLLRAQLSVALQVVKLWVERSRSRASLQQLEDWQLVDLGLTREQVEQEARKHFWQD